MKIVLRYLVRLSIYGLCHLHCHWKKCVSSTHHRLEVTLKFSLIQADYFASKSLLYQRSPFFRYFLIFCNIRSRIPGSIGINGNMGMKLVKGNGFF